MSNAERDEWLRVMLELGELDREAYREIRSKAWGRVAVAHARKTPEQIEAWRKVAS